MARVVHIHEHGGADVLRHEQADDASPGTGEVTTAVAAIGLDRSEIMFRNGRHIEPAIFPARLGYEAAGVVKEVGAGVYRFTVGDRVCLVPLPSLTRWGTHADAITVPADHVVSVSPHLSLVDTAATWMAAITAYGTMVDVGGVRAGDTVLVLAATSSVGLDAAWDVALAGLGIAWVPYWLAAGALRSGVVSEVLPGWRVQHYKLLIVRRDRRLTPKRVQDLIDFLKSHAADFTYPKC